jgi:SecD/SecF fusion protein
MQMNGQGAKAWEELTGRAYTQKKQYIVLDDIVYSAQEYLATYFRW